MATSKVNVKNRHHFMWGAVVAILLLLLFWQSAERYGWWPFKKTLTVPSTSASTGTTANGAAGTNGTTGATGGTVAVPSGTSNALFTLYGSIHNGQTKADVAAAAGTMSPSCVTANLSTGGKQEVCTYQDGSQVVTVTYLNDRTAAISKSGF